jgi:hypothetical protein
VEPAAARADAEALAERDAECEQLRTELTLARSQTAAAEAALRDGAGLRWEEKCARLEQV